MASPRADRASRSAEQPDPFGFKAIRDELDAAFTALRTFSNTLVSLQNGLDAATTTAEEEIARRTRRIEELEGENEQQREHIERLRRRNAQSRARAQQAADNPSADVQAQLQALMAERDDLRTELRHAVNFAHDLSARVKNNESMASTSPRSRHTTAQPSASPKTPSRPGPAPGPSRMSREPPPSPKGPDIPEKRPRQQPSRAARVETVHSDDDGQAAPNNDSASEGTVEGPRDQYENYSFDAGPPPPGEEPVLSYQWKFSDLPNASRIRCGPMTLEQLERLLNLEEAILQELHELDERTEAREFRLCNSSNSLFLIDPIFLETPSETYLMMWMTPEKAMQTHDEHWEGGPPETEYHTTIRLTDQGAQKWYYIGKLRWSFANLPPQWPRYISLSKQRLAHALHERWKTELTPREISGLIEDDKFQQFCIWLSSDEELEARSKKYARKRLPGISMQEMSDTPGPS